MPCNSSPSPLDYDWLETEFGTDWPQRLALFVASTRPVIAALADALAGGHQAAALDAAHGAKGSAQMIGAGLLAEQCARIEAALESGDLVAAQRHGPGVAPLFAAVEAQLLAVQVA